MQGEHRPRFPSLLAFAAELRWDVPDLQAAQHPPDVCLRGAVAEEVCKTNCSPPHLNDD